MISKTVELKFTKKQQLATVGVTSCWHVGNPASRIDKIEAMLKK